MKRYLNGNGILILVILCNVAILICFISQLSPRTLNFSPNYNTYNTTINTTETIIRHVNNTTFTATLKEALQQTLNAIYNISGKTTKPHSDPRGVSSDHYDPLKTNRSVHTSYNKSRRLKIKIAIPTFINAHENSLRKIQRQSWIKYLDTSNNLWNNTHSLCDISYNYFTGISNNTNENITIDKENKIYNDIIRLNVVERWDHLQMKTIDMLLSEYLINKQNSFDLLLKTDTDSYVNVPNLCHFMVKLMDLNNWNGQLDGLYLGDLRTHGTIWSNPGNKYENKQWMNQIGQKQYIPFMSGFGYFVTFKTTEIIYNSLHTAKYDIAVNRLEDTYLGHYLTSFDVKFVDLRHIITMNCFPNVFGLNNYIIDHAYKKTDGNIGVLMVGKYKLHYILHQLYIRTNETYGYNPKMMLL